MPAPRTMRVVCNPYAAPADHEGRLHAHFQFEPNLRGGDVDLRWIGCRLQAKTLVKADPKTQTLAQHDHAWVYDPAPVTVPVRAYYLRALARRELLAADIATHALAFGTKSGFVDPHARLAQYARERGVVPEPADTWRPLLDVHAPAPNVSAEKESA